MLTVSGEQQRYVERLQDLMTDENTINLRYLKLFLVGPPGVGKTTTLERLRKEIENILSAGDKKISSTMLANCVQVLAFVSGNEADSEWLSSSNLDEEAQILFRYMCSTFDQVSEPPDEEEGDSTPPEPTPKMKVAAQSKEEPKKKTSPRKRTNRRKTISLRKTTNPKKKKKNLEQAKQHLLLTGMHNHRGKWTNLVMPGLMISCTN